MAVKQSQLPTDGKRPRAYSYIRFSTPAQADGDSLRRQMAASVKYAEAHGLELDDQFNLRDLGVSAFRGKNRERGQLKAFLNAVEAGQIAPGSYLLVESLDRLSREKVSSALSLFTDIINAGINLVTLIDQRCYSAESVNGNFTELIVSIAILSRANDESETKSTRRRETWHQQRRVAAASSKKMTRKLPFWLELKDLHSDFVVNNEAATTVRRVFEMAKAGLGYWKIAQTLNAEGIPSPSARSYTKAPKDGGERLWATSSVGALLHNESVIGNLVLPEVKLKAKEGEPPPEPVPDRFDGYYPRIIDDALFYAVQTQRPAPKGRTSPLKTNLFTGLLRCGYCGGPLQVDTRTKGDRRTSTIRCTRKRKGLGCQNTPWPYHHFEEAFFQFVSEVRVADILMPSQDKRQEELQGRADKLKAEQVAAQLSIDRLMRQIEGMESAPRSLSARIAELEQELDRIQPALTAVEQQLNDERTYQERAERELTAIRSQFEALDQLPEAERIQRRYAIAERVASLVKTVQLYPAGSYLQLVDIDTGELRPRDTEPHFRVEFRNGWTGFVTPSRQSSSRFNLSKPGD